jgi:predicted Fe-Mo cluster-binding NifX family protein
MAKEIIGFVCDDAQTISAHFGRAPLVVAVTIEDGREVARDVRPRGEGGHHHDHDHDHDHSHDHSHHHRDHAPKFAELADCQVMVVRGIGSPALDHAQGMAMAVYLVDQPSVDAALAAYLAGTLISDSRRIHHH